MLYTKEKAQAMLGLIVAEKGFEPMTFGLWAQRATTAPLRDVLMMQRYCFFLILQTFSVFFFFLPAFLY